MSTGPRTANVVHVVHDVALALRTDLFGVGEQRADGDFVCLTLRPDRDGRALGERLLALRRVREVPARGRQAGGHDVGAG